MPARLMSTQQQVLVAQVARGGFRTCDEARQWVAEQFGDAYGYQGMHSLRAWLGCHPKTPRPAATVVWNGSGADHGKRLADLPVRRVFLPPDRPEPNPAERVFAELRRRVEGRVYVDLDAKQAVAEAYLQTLADDPARVRRLCGWEWIGANLDRLPPPDDSRCVFA